MLAHESQVRLAEGETKTYAESSQNYELAFTSDSDANTEQVITLPQSLLVPGREIQNPNLPFTLRVKNFWKNSGAAFRAPMVANGPPLTTNGVAANFDFQPQPEVKTMDDKNVPTAEFEIIGPNGSLGDWAVSGWTADDAMVDGLRQDYTRELGPDMARQIVKDLTHPQTVSVNGKTFSFALRPERVYLPFSMTLLKATHTVYQGTDIPKDFRSRVQLQNPRTGENRAVEIYMNSPLRYSGLTFYQYQMTAGEMVEQAGAIPSSVLQVVRNPSWLTPYVGCGLVAVGLVVQFMFHLVGFINKRKTT
jgi:hypothetical protein